MHHQPGPSGGITLRITTGIEAVDGVSLQPLKASPTR